MSVSKFTIIELIVVIAVIGILITMLLPELTKARELSKQAVCLSNQRQIGIATIGYINENRGYGPYSPAKRSGQRGRNNKWDIKLINSGFLQKSDRYRFKKSDVQECPNGPDLATRYKSNFGMSEAVVDKTWLRGEKMFKSTLGANPSETAIGMDSVRNGLLIGYFDMTVNKLLLVGPKQRIARHQGKANVLYLDGSGKAKTASYLLGTKSSIHTLWDVTQ